ncbi:hypothetical protein [Novosphingobium sp. 9U]|uniref:hypothetical protein n=1 Tax=Novosphingobium sp. 9U TaxID=2653158 RepID=UPI0012EEE6E9|nr:hypothetical protein [Novosphingobium sp. 9U]VWX54270.1 conserved membrane hypothetical protein [Novosphingobium sp. 9U]
MNRSLALASPRFELATFAALAAVMLITRTHSLSHVVHLPDTSLASFFVLGYLVRRPTAFGALFLLGFAIDVWKIYVMGGSGFCFTPAYWMLLPAYGVMWFAGRFVADKFGERLSALLPAAVLLLLATFVSNLFSSGGFYFLGGRFADPSVAEFLPRLQKYFPGTLLATLLWSGVGAAAYVALLTARPELRRARAK